MVQDPSGSLRWCPLAPRPRAVAAVAGGRVGDDGVAEAVQVDDGRPVAGQRPEPEEGDAGHDPKRGELELGVGRQEIRKLEQKYYKETKILFKKQQCLKKQNIFKKLKYF